MALILTYLGKGGCGSTTLAIATAKRLAQEGRRVLLAIQDSSPAPSVLLGQSLAGEPAELSSNLWALRLQTASLLEQSWEEVKDLEAQYLRTPLLKNVYGQELGVLPGMDGALALNALRQFDASGRYDVIVFDGHSAMDTLRMFGLPEILDWYVRRFRGVFQESDLGRALAPFIQPVATAVLSVDWQGDILDRPTGEMRSVLEQGREAVSNPQRGLGLLATTPSPDAVATARYLWGSAQQIGLTIGGVLVNHGDLKAEQEGSFAPLMHKAVPTLDDDNWDALTAALPNIEQLATTAPRATVIDGGAKIVKLFLPSFDKSQVKLTQYGPEVTIEAGDQRRNLLLPPQLQGRAVTGAKFQDQYLVVSFG
jgi:arsenite-transporting ATPase